MPELQYDISVDSMLCTGCGLCTDFCPVEVFTDQGQDDRHPQIRQAEACWGCMTCVGQCPVHAIEVAARPQSVSQSLAPEQTHALPPAPESRRQYVEYAQTLKDILGLRWSAVAISLIKADDPLPDVPIPHGRMRYCQSLMAARRGQSILLPVDKHACPDGTSILGLSEMPKKLASGELYLLFHKLDSIEAAQHMALERPMLPARSIRATLVTPLERIAAEPDVVAVFANPEQVMWLLMSSSYYSGARHDLHASGYNAQCVETTLIPYQSGKLNVSFGCYGCRAASDVSDDLMFVGIPAALLPEVIKGLKELGKKAIPQSRNKIYLPVS